MILRIALDTPLRSLFDYLPPPATAGVAEPGCRVRIPFGRREQVGIVVAVAERSDVAAAKLRRVSELLDRTPVFDTALLALLRWCADYYHHPIGEVLAAALPKLAREGAPPVALAEHWQLTAAGATACSSGEPRRAPKQRALLEHLQQADGGASADALTAQLPNWRDAARALAARGWIASSEVPMSVADEMAGGAPAATATPRDTPPALTDAQAQAVAALDAAADRFQTLLLHGITGSGKTEVYLHGVARRSRAAARAGAGARDRPDAAARRRASRAASACRSPCCIRD
jgi:primosomal protein N' (replication factor Y) (superfamily II helicase)